jgi:hypothetical protein
MSEDQIVALLTEIRDLHKQNAENYKLALQRQQEAMELQKQFQAKVAQRQKTVLFTVVGIVIITFLLIAMLPHLFK